MRLRRSTKSLIVMCAIAGMIAGVGLGWAAVPAFLAGVSIGYVTGTR